MPENARRGMGAPAAGGTDRSEKPDVGAGN